MVRMICKDAAASKLRPDGVLGFHSALELHAIACSELNEVQLVSAERTERVEEDASHVRWSLAARMVSRWQANCI